MKHFNQSQVKWNRWQPTDIIFKSNPFVKKIVPSAQILSYSTKHDRNHKMAQLTGGKCTQSNFNGQISNRYSMENHRAIHVKLKDLKTDFPVADVDFLDYTNREDSVGQRLPHIDALVYISSFHNRGKYTQNPQGQWDWSAGKYTCGINEGYRVAYGGQGDSNYMSFEDFEELSQICSSIKNFLVNIVCAYKNGTLVESLDSLTEPCPF